MEGRPTRSDSSPPSTTSGGTTSTGSTSDPVSGPPVIGASVVELDHFRSPTGNIGCLITTERVQCEIAEHDFALPPESTPCVQSDWVASLQVTSTAGTAPTVGACQSDTVLGAAHELPYGTASVIGDFACLSQESGMTCWNQVTRHGFSVARANYAVF